MAENEKVAIVTGSAQGIGREIARELLPMGMLVVAVDIREDLPQTLPEALGHPGDRLDCRVLDVTADVTADLAGGQP